MADNSRTVPQMAQTNGVDGAEKPDYDAIVVGAGFAGLRMIHELRERKMTYIVIEAGTGVGGVSIFTRTLEYSTTH